MKTIKFLKDFREHKKGDIKTFQSDHKADSILLVEGVAVVTDNPTEEKQLEGYEDKMLTTKNKRGRKSKKV